MTDFYVIQDGAAYPQSYCETVTEAEQRAADLEATRGGSWRIIPCDDWTAEREASYLAQPVTEITEERFWEMLEILPPKDVPCGACDRRFNMSEFQFGRITEQFAKIGDRYFAKYVRHGDVSTYIEPAAVL